MLCEKTREYGVRGLGHKQCSKIWKKDGNLAKFSLIFLGALNLPISYKNFLIYCFLSFLSLCGDTSLQPSKHLLPCIKYNNILVSDSKKNHENSSANWMKNRSIFAKKKKGEKMEKVWRKICQSDVLLSYTYSKSFPLRESSITTTFLQKCQLGVCTCTSFKLTLPFIFWRTLHLKLYILCKV